MKFVFGLPKEKREAQSMDVQSLIRHLTGLVIVHGVHILFLLYTNRGKRGDRKAGELRGKWGLNLKK